MRRGKNTIEDQHALIEHANQMNTGKTELRQAIRLEAEHLIATDPTIKSFKAAAVKLWQDKYPNLPFKTVRNAAYKSGRGFEEKDSTIIG